MDDDFSFDRYPPDSDLASILPDNPMPDIEQDVPQQAQHENDGEVIRIEEENSGNANIFGYSQTPSLLNNHSKPFYKSVYATLDDPRHYKHNFITITPTSQLFPQNNVTNMNFADICPPAAGNNPHPQSHSVPVVMPSAPATQVLQVPNAFHGMLPQQPFAIESPSEQTPSSESSAFTVKRKGPGRPCKTPPRDMSVINGTGRGRFKNNRSHSTRPEHIDVHYLRRLINNKEICADTLNLPINEAELCDEGKKLWKKIRRMVKNRQSAQLSRQRKRELVDSQEDTIESLRTENEQLKAQCSKLAEDLVLLRENYNVEIKRGVIADFIDSFVFPKSNSESTSDESD